jgi:hypothetical protein
MIQTQRVLLLNVETLNRVKDLFDLLEVLQRLERTECGTHAQRNAAAHLQRLLVEKIRDEIPRLQTPASLKGDTYVEILDDGLPF